MRAGRVFWIGGIGKPEPRPVLVLHEEPGQWLLCATGTSQDHPEREPPPRIRVLAGCWLAKSLGLSKTTWFDKLGITVDIPPARFTGEGRKVPKKLRDDVVDMAHAAMDLGKLGNAESEALAVVAS